jgi:hypothetical protein
MSMKKVRDALAMLNAETDEQEEAVQAAYQEVESIEMMAQTLAVRMVEEIRANGMTNAASVLSSLAEQA